MSAHSLGTPEGEEDSMTTTIYENKLSNIANTDVVQPMKANDDLAVLNTSIRDILFEAKAFEVGKCLVCSGAYGVMFTSPPSEWLTWKSGIKAPVYCDCRVINSLPLERKLISATLVESIKQNFSEAEVVIGIAMAGIPWARAVADRLDLPFAYVRNRTKPHGTGKRVECAPPTEKKAIIVDDLVASGGSILDTITVLKEEAQVDVIGVQSIVNWGFHSMRHNLAGYRVKCLASYPCLLANALMHRIIDQTQFSQLMEFYADPIHFEWPQLADDDDQLQNGQQLDE